MMSRLTSNKWPFLAFGVYAVIICMGKPLGAAQNTVGAANTFTATLDESVMAITNAFSGWTYHRMGLVPNSDHYDTAKRRWTSQPATNEWSLLTHEPPPSRILIPWDKTMVPYSVQFQITSEPLASNQCRVTVTTTSALIPHGREIGIHGGWAVHMKRIPPVLAEETNVLARIEQQLVSIQAGHAEPLPATPDTVEGLRQPMKVDLELHPEMKERLLHAIQTETNAALKGELLKMLIAATNTSTKSTP